MLFWNEVAPEAKIIMNYNVKQIESFILVLSLLFILMISCIYEELCHTKHNKLWHETKFIHVKKKDVQSCSGNNNEK